MSKGYVILAQNSDVNYIRQAYALALSIKKTQPTINKISLVTDDIVEDKYKNVFDEIIKIPFGDHAVNSVWKIENRWKLYHATPYDETIVLDTDMLFLDNMEHLWSFVKDRDLFFTSDVRDFRGKTIIDSVYRKTFRENNLSNLYSALYYFKKSDKNLEFFKVLEFITYNWEKIYYEITPKQTQKFYSLDVSAAIAAKILNIEEDICSKNSPFSFIHMKPGVQSWDPVPESFLTQTVINFNQHKELYLNNYRQHGIIHYVEDCFLTDDIINLHV